jgi:hypothetical protein
MVYYKKNNLKAATDLWHEVLTLDPDHQGAREMLRQVDSESGPGGHAETPS